MPGNYKVYVTFPFEFDKAKSARIQMEPFVCASSYGITVKVILELTGGKGDNTYTYERVAIEDAITQENIRDGFMSAPFIEVMEGFYYNKTEKEVLIPVCALILKIYFSDLLEAFGVDLGEFISEVSYEPETIGFNKSEISYARKPQTNTTSYKTAESTPLYAPTPNKKENSESNCQAILRSIKKKSTSPKT